MNNWQKIIIMEISQIFFVQINCKKYTFLKGFKIWSTCGIERSANRDHNCILDVFLEPFVECNMVMEIDNKMKAFVGEAK